ncbi:MAG: tetratricopeptide repeat protein [Gemmatimonadota bacterium]|nr:tetratricopeptide repeat protein [Gemmatimonadota bacterium]
MAKIDSMDQFGGDVAEARFADMFDRYRQHLGWIGVAIIVAGVGAWFYLRSESIKSERADAAYEAALQSVSSGNIPLAQSDLSKAATRYAGTNGGSEAAMALAKLDFQQSKYQDGISALRGPASNGGDLQFEARMLMGSGYEGMTQWAQAAKTYEDAASIARFDGDKASARAMAARALQAGGEKAGAIKIWNDLINNPHGSFATEAEIRLGELQGAPVKS